MNRTKFQSMLTGEHSRTAERIIAYADSMVLATVVAIDPGSKSCGYAIAHQGKFKTSGHVEVPKQFKRIGPRLKYIHAELDKILTPYNKIYMLVEKVRPRTGHIYLTWAAGVAVATGGCVVEVIEIPIGMWKKLCPADYEKSDIADAEKILEVGLVLLNTEE